MGAHMTYICSDHVFYTWKVKMVCTCFPYVFPYENHMAPIWSNMLFKCAKHMDNTCFPYVFPYENHIVLTLSHMFFMCSNHVMLKTGGLLMCFICFPCGFHVLKSCVYHIFKTCRKHLVFKWFSHGMHMACHVNPRWLSCNYHVEIMWFSWSR